MFQLDMNVTGRLVLVTGVFLVVAACHKTPEKPQATATDTASIAAPAPVPVKPSLPLPGRMPGLWQTSVAEEGSAGPPQEVKICIDALTDKHLGILGTDLSGDNCNTRTFSPQPDGSWGILAECTVGAGIITEYSGSVKGSYQNRYKMSVRSQTTGGNQMNRVTNYVVTSKRLGGCTSGQKPGDLINAGVKMNLFDMAGMTRGGSKAAESEAPPPDVVD
jgi:hypothetical protein